MAKRTKPVAAAKNGAERRKGYILRASFTDKNGQKHYAKDHGKRAFRISV